MKSLNVQIQICGCFNMFSVGWINDLSFYILFNSISVISCHRYLGSVFFCFLENLDHYLLSYNSNMYNLYKYFWTRFKKDPVCYQCYLYTGQKSFQNKGMGVSAENKRYMLKIRAREIDKSQSVRLFSK